VASVASHPRNLAIADGLAGDLPVFERDFDVLNIHPQELASVS
jgi:hypothetical protein